MFKTEKGMNWITEHARDRSALLTSLLQCVGDYLEHRAVMIRDSASPLTLLHGTYMLDSMQTWMAVNSSNRAGLADLTSINVQDLSAENNVCAGGSDNEQS